MTRTPPPCAATAASRTHARRRGLPHPLPALGRGLLLAALLAGPALAQTAGDPLRPPLPGSGAGQPAAIPVPLVDPLAAGAVGRDPAELRHQHLLDRLRHADQRATRAPAGVGLAPALTAAAGRGIGSQVAPLHPAAGQGQRNGSRLRIEGERREVDFTLFLTEPERVQALRLTTASSINVLPERSRFRVIVNGTVLGSGALENFTGAAGQDLPVQPGQLRAGVNTVRVEIDHHHRIFCGPDAAFGLWSDIDLAWSGAVLEGADLTPSGEAFLVGLAAASASGAGYEIRNADALGPRRDEILAALTGRLADAVAGEAVPFRLTGHWTVATERPVTARITFRTGPVAGTRFLRGGDGAQVMAITLPPDAGPADLPDLNALLPRLPAGDAIALMDSRGPVRLADLGFRSIELQGRYALESARFRLPDDYVVLSNLKAVLNLTYAFAPGLPDGAMLQIHVNGTNVRLLPLWTGGGEVIEDYPIRFPAHHLRAGVNTIGFEMIVPGNPPDLPCPPRVGPSVAVSDLSSLTVPYSPSMYLADMHMAFSAIEADGIRVSDLARSHYSARDLLMLRAALRQGRPSPIFELPPRLHLIPLEDLGAVPAGNYRIDRAMLAAVLSRPLPDLSGEPLAAGTAAPGAELLGRGGQLRGAQPAVMTAGWTWLTDRLQATLQWMHPRPGDFLAEWLDGRHGQAILLQLDPALPSHLWMIRAPDADTDRIIAAIATARATGEGPRGQVSVLDHRGAWHNWYAPDRQPVLLEPLGLRNLRHAMGNFVSATPIRFVSLLFLLALISAVFALRLVIATRETPQ